MNETDIFPTLERLGSTGLLGWLVVWATTRAWPKVSAHLDGVSQRLDHIAAELRQLREEMRSVRSRLEVIDKAS